MLGIIIALKRCDHPATAEGHVRNPIKTHRITTGHVIAAVLVLVATLAVAPRPVAAQQCASVLVRVNVIRAPMAPAALDSLSRAARESVSAPTRALVAARLRARGVRMRVTRVGDVAHDSPRPVADESRAAPPSDVVLVEYVAN